MSILKHKLHGIRKSRDTKESNKIISISEWKSFLNKELVEIL